MTITIQSLFSGPWPWYLAGPLMGATIPLLLFWGNKMLGASSTLQHLCTLVPSKISYFRYDIREGMWNLFFGLGVLLGGSLTYAFAYAPERVDIAEATRRDLLQLGLTDLSGLMPAELFATEQLWSVNGLIFTLFGGFLVGFGVRYAGGCTSGHGFMGLSQLSWSSAIAIVSFFTGGVLFTHLILPLLLQHPVV